jgi:hypothetical protein
MKKEDLVNTKWDVSNWTTEQKIKWQESVFELGFRWPIGEMSIQILNADYHYIDTKNITSSTDHDFFEQHRYIQRYYADLFPENEEGWLTPREATEWLLSGGEIDRYYIDDDAPCVSSPITWDEMKGPVTKYGEWINLHSFRFKKHIKQHTYFLNFYKSGAIERHDSLDEANKKAGLGRIACIEVSFLEGEGLREVMTTEASQEAPTKKDLWEQYPQKLDKTSVKE